MEDLLIKAENEALGKGESVETGVFDDHYVHIKDHIDYLKSNPQVNHREVIKHINKHINNLKMFYSIE